jgi:hypothetical protein
MPTRDLRGGGPIVRVIRDKIYGDFRSANILYVCPIDLITVCEPSKLRNCVLSRGQQIGDLYSKLMVRTVVFSIAQATSHLPSWIRSHLMLLPRPEGLLYLESAARAHPDAPHPEPCHLGCAGWEHPPERNSAVKEAPQHLGPLYNSSARNSSKLKDGQARRRKGRWRDSMWRQQSRQP